MKKLLASKMMRTALMLCAAMTAALSMTSCDAPRQQQWRQPQGWQNTQPLGKRQAGYGSRSSARPAGVETVQSKHLCLPLPPRGYEYSSRHDTVPFPGYPDGFYLVRNRVGPTVQYPPDLYWMFWDWAWSEGKPIKQFEAYAPLSAW